MAWRRNKLQRRTHQPTAFHTHSLSTLPRKPHLGTENGEESMSLLYCAATALSQTLQDWSLIVESRMSTSWQRIRLGPPLISDMRTQLDGEGAVGKGKEKATEAMLYAPDVHRVDSLRSRAATLMPNMGLNGRDRHQLQIIETRSNAFLVRGS